MNTQLRPASLSISTRAAEGLDRRRWTVAEIEAMVEAGILLEDERFELIGGEIVPMSPKDIQHEVIKGYLNAHWMKRLPHHLMIIQETTFRISADAFLEPDFLFYPKSVGVSGISPETVLLAVEVADSSLAYDRGRKARLYASLGVPGLWVINAVKRTSRVFTKPGPDGYGDIRDLKSSEPLVPGFAPELSVTIGTLDLD
jgi:Uma2 family endonuclease